MLPHILKQELIEKELGILGANSLEDLENSEDLEDDLIEKVITNVILNNIPTDCKRGDVIYLDVDNFREYAKMIWDGEHAVWLEWGHVPKQFAYPEFAMDHWNDSITDNRIRWTSKDNLDKLRTEYRVEENNEIFKNALDNYYELNVLDTEESYLITPFHVEPLEYNHTDCETSLYGLSSTYNDGFGGFSEVFKASSTSQIYQYILHEIKLWLQGHNGNGEHYWIELERSDWNNISKFKPFTNQKEFIKTADWTFVQDIFNHSYVDGDSSPQIALTKIKIEETTDLTLM
jgi:hypothetical protein